MNSLSTYRCDRCNSEQSASSLRMRSYVLGEEDRLPVRARLAWCGVSSLLVAKEFLPELDELLALRKMLVAREPSVGDRTDDEALRDQAHRDHLLGLMIGWMEGRTSPARCLHCGSTEADELRGQEEGDPHEFLHPECGGTFRLIGQSPIEDPTIELYTSEGMSLQSPAGLTADQLIEYFHQAVTDPASVGPWSQWWSENEKQVSQAFPLVDYVRLKHRKLTGARQILQLRGRLPKEFVPPDAQATGSCANCGERMVWRGDRRVCPNCGTI